MQATIEKARQDDLADLFSLMERSRLPIDGLGDHLATALVARKDGQLVGSAVLEIYADGALLRSVAVTPMLHGRGLGHELTEAAIQLAVEQRAPAMYLLTTTAESFFPKFGFERIARADVPASVQASVEFTSACPSTATVMRKSL
jgi:amino-acid N-acetyltransferase